MHDVETGLVTHLERDTHEEIQFVAEEGLDYLEVTTDGDNHCEALAGGRGDELRGRLEEHDLDMLVHLPFPLDIGSPHEAVREGAIEEHREVLRTVADLGARRAVLHPEASALSIWEDDEIRANIDRAVRELAAFGADRGVEVCPENLFDNHYTLENIEGLLAATDADLTLDTGHARVAGFDGAETAAFVREHRDRISHVHLNDTRGPEDEHLPFGAGDVDFAAIFDAFGEDWTGTLSLEVLTPSFEYLRHSTRALEDLL